MSALDGREPFAIDIADLGRRAGAMIRMERTVPAPAELTSPVIGVPAQSSLELDLMAESVVEGVLISGSVAAQLDGSCSRCLDPVQDEITVPIQELFRYEPPEEAAAEDEDIPVIEGEILDLEPTVRDAVVLSLPLTPVCKANCLGLCPDCGARLEDDPSHKHDKTDPRWAALAGFQTEPDSTKTNEG